MPTVADCDATDLLMPPQITGYADNGGRAWWTTEQIHRTQKWTSKSARHVLNGDDQTRVPKLCRVCGKDILTEWALAGLERLLDDHESGWLRVAKFPASVGSKVPAVGKRSSVHGLVPNDRHIQYRIHPLLHSNMSSRTFAWLMHHCSSTSGDAQTFRAGLRSRTRKLQQAPRRGDG